MNKLKHMPKNRGSILAEMQYVENRGDTYALEGALYRRCAKARNGLTWPQFRAETDTYIDQGLLHRQEGKVYLRSTWDYESYAAERLASILADGSLPLPLIPVSPKCGEVYLNASQMQALHMALSNRLSLILGGAGAGKTTLIRAICGGFPGNTVVCAPTGKAARNLLERAGVRAYTVHGALGKVPEDNFLSDVVWPAVKLVIVDEASMLTLEMLAGLLCKVGRDCRIVLVGDPNQLPAVGAGNVLSDLLALGVPHIVLPGSYRVSDGDSALARNVLGFEGVRRSGQLHYDDSFQFIDVPREEIRRRVCGMAAEMYRTGADVQVISPRNRGVDCSVDALNWHLRNLINPYADGEAYIKYRNRLFWEGDKVMILQNDRARGCCNGDIGMLRIPMGQKGFEVDLPGGTARWDEENRLDNIALAYALTVHKSQGSQYGTVIMPLCRDFAGMLNRSLLYTAISRAKSKVILVGERAALDTALANLPPSRNTMLVPRTKRLTA